MSENVKRWYVYNGELLSGDEYDPAEDDENLYVPVVFGPGYDALLAERDALREALGQIYRMPCAFPDDKHESQKIVINFGVAQQIAGAALAWRAATGEGVQRLRDAIHTADRELITIADFSIQEAADAIDSVRASLKDALAETDVPAPDDARSVPDPVLCAACGGTGHRNGNRRAADPFGTCPGCNGTGVRPAPANPYTLTAQTTAAHAWNEGFAAGRSAERARLAEIDVMAFGKATCARFTYAEEQPYEAVGDRDSLRLRAFLDAYLRAALSEGTPDSMTDAQPVTDPGASS